MTRLRTRAIRALVVLGWTFLLGIPGRSSAQEDLAGIPVVANHTGEEHWPSLVPDGHGGVYVAFKDPIGSTTTISHLSAAAVPLSDWSPTSQAMYSENQAVPTRFAPRGTGRFWMMSDYTGNMNSLAMRSVDASGASDVTVGSYMDPFGVAICAVTDERTLAIHDSLDQNIHCFVADSTGVVTSVSFSTSPYGHYAPVAIPDQQNGAFVVFEGGDGGLQGWNLIAIRLDSSGQPEWPGTYRIVVGQPGDQRGASVVADGAGGAIVCWTDKRSSASAEDLYAMHVQSDGSLAAGWPIGGKLIVSAPGAQWDSQMVSDGAGGVWIVWVDGRTGENDLYYSHLLPNGTIASDIPAGGQLLCSAPGSQVAPCMVKDGYGGFFAAWSDERDGELDLYGQHITSAGTVAPGWDINGSPLCTDPTPQLEPAMCATSAGNAIVAWSDTRTGTSRVYARALPAPLLAAPPAGVAQLDLAVLESPTRRAIELRVSVRSGDDARVELVDIMGRVRAEDVVHGPARDAAVRFGGPIAPGLYFARMTQGSARVTRRVVRLD